MPDRKDAQECVVLAFSARPVKKAPEDIEQDVEDLQVAIDACVADINRDAETITKAMMDIKHMVHEFAEFVKKCDH